MHNLAEHGLSDKDKHMMGIGSQEAPEQNGELLGLKTRTQGIEKLCTDKLIEAYGSLAEAEKYAQMEVTQRVLDPRVGDDVDLHHKINYARGFVNALKDLKPIQEALNKGEVMNTPLGHTYAEDLDKIDFILSSFTNLTPPKIESK